MGCRQWVANCGCWLWAAGGVVTTGGQPIMKNRSTFKEENVETEDRATTVATGKAVPSVF